MRTEIQLSPAAVRQINESLTKGNSVEISVRNGTLIIWETSSKKKYEVCVAQR